MKRFEGKVVIVTGGASGIGAATVEAFLEEGAKVTIADYSDKGQAYSDSLNAKGNETLFVKTDVRNEEQVKNMVAKTVEAFGRLDVLFANAGIGEDTALCDLSKETWDKTIDINLTGVFLSDKHAILQMIKQGEGGAIVNSGSIHSFVGKPGLTAYCAAKGGVRLLTSTASVMYAKNNIRINAVAPGYIATPLLGGLEKEIYDQLAALHPLGRLGRPEEVAKAVLFLASDDASFISGSILTIDGGYTAQ